MSGDISGAGGSLVKTGTGTLTLIGAKTYTGGTTISGGTLQFGNGISGGSINLAGSINVTGGTLAIQAPTTLNVAQTVTFGDTTTLSIAAGTGSPVLSANSVTIGNGVTFNLSGISDASQLDLVLIDTTSGIGGDFASISVGGFSGTVDYLTLSTRKSADGLQYLASYNLAWNAHNTLAHGTFTLTNATDSFTVGAVLADQAANPATGWNGTALTKAGAGTLILTGTNTYTGGTTISGGTLQIGNGGTTGSILGDVVNNGQLVFNRSNAISFNGAMSGTGGLTKQGSGVLILSGTNSYSGETSIEAGALVIDAARAMSAASDYIIATGAQLQISDGLGAVTAASIAGAGAIQIGNGSTLKAGGSNASTTFSGSISGNGGFEKTGTGTLTLTGTNTYTGATKVSSGKLVVNGSITSTVTLDGGTLGGSGTVGGVSVASGATVAPGNSIGTLTVSGNVSFASGSTLSGRDQRRRPGRQDRGVRQCDALGRHGAGPGRERQLRGVDELHHPHRLGRGQWNLHQRHLEPRLPDAVAGLRQSERHADHDPQRHLVRARQQWRHEWRVAAATPARAAITSRRPATRASSRSRRSGLASAMRSMTR